MMILNCSYEIDTSCYPNRMVLVYPDDLILESNRYVFIPEWYVGIDYTIIGFKVSNCVTIKTTHFELYYTKNANAEQIPMTNFPVLFEYAFTTDPEFIQLIENKEFQINNQVNTLTISRILYPPPEVGSLYVLTAKVTLFNYGTYHTNEYVFPTNQDITLENKNYLILYEDLIDEYKALNSLRFQNRVEMNSTQFKFFKQDNAITQPSNGKSPMEEMDIVDIITQPYLFTHSNEVQLEETQWLYQFKIKDTTYYVHLKYGPDDLIPCTLSRIEKNVQLIVENDQIMRQYALFDSSQIRDGDIVNSEIIMKGTVQFTNPVLYLFFNTNFNGRTQSWTLNVTGKALYDSKITKTKSGSINFTGCTVRSTYNVVHAKYHELMYERYITISDPVVFNELPTLLQFDSDKESSILFTYNELRYIECLSSVTAYHDEIGLKIELKDSFGKTIYNFNPTSEVPMYTKYTIETITIPENVSVGIDGFAHFKNMNLVNDTSLSGYKIQCTPESLRTLSVEIREHNKTYDVILLENTQLDGNDYMCSFDKNTSIGNKRFSGDLFYEKNLIITSNTCKLWIDLGDTTILLVGAMCPMSEEASETLNIPEEFKTSKTTFQLETYVVSTLYIPIEFEVITILDELHAIIDRPITMYAILDGKYNLNKEKTFVIDFGQIDDSVDKALHYTDERPDEVNVTVRTGDYFIIPTVSFTLQLHWFYRGKEWYVTQVAPIEQDYNGMVFATRSVLSTLYHDDTLNTDVIESELRKWYVRSLGEFIPSTIEYINSTNPITVKCTLPRDIELTNSRILLGEETINSTMNVLIPEFSTMMGTRYVIITQLLGTSIVHKNVKKIEIAVSVEGEVSHIPVNEIYHDENGWIYFEEIDKVHNEIDENGVSNTPVITSQGIEWYTSKGRETSEPIDENGYIRYGWYIMNDIYDSIYRKINVLHEKEGNNMIKINENLSFTNQTNEIKGVKWYDEYQIERYDIQDNDMIEIMDFKTDQTSKVVIPKGNVRITGRINHNGELTVQSLEV